MRCSIERTFYHVDGKGEEQELPIIIDINICDDDGICCEFLSSAYRSRAGKWVDIDMNEWLGQWVRDEFERIDEGELYAALDAY